MAYELAGGAAMRTPEEPTPEARRIATLWAEYEAARLATFRAGTSMREILLGGSATPAEVLERAEKADRECQRLIGFARLLDRELHS